MSVLFCFCFPPERTNEDSVTERVGQVTLTEEDCLIGTGLWEFNHTPVSIWTIQIKLGVFFLVFLLLLGTGDKSGGMNLEGE